MPYESRTLPVVVIPPCYRYTNRPGLPAFPGCQLPSGYSRALSIVVTTLLCLVLDSNQSFCFCSVLPLHQLSIYREKGVRSPVCLRVSLVPIISHYRGLQSSTGNRDARPAWRRWLLPIRRIQMTYSTTSLFSQPQVTMIQLGVCQMATLFKVELLLCRFLELEYRLPPWDFHPPNPSLNLIPRLYFCCMLTTAIVRHTPTLPLPHTQLNQYQLDLVSGLAVHHSVCLQAKHFGRHPIESSTVMP